MLSKKLLDYSVFKDPAGNVSASKILPDGGEYRARTGDLRLAKPALSQLS